MTQLEVFYVIVRPVLADSLGMDDRQEIWLTCTLEEDLLANQPEDLADIAWRLNRRFEELNLGIAVEAKELKAPQREIRMMTVADIVMLICRKLDAAAVPATVVDAS